MTPYNNQGKRMTFTDSIKTCFNKYATFSGRATRSEYWWFVLFILLAYIVLLALTSVMPDLASIAFGVFVLGTIIPQMSVAVRRLHDSDKSGWWLLINFIPFGSLVLLYFYVVEGTEGDNQYGTPAE